MATRITMIKGLASLTGKKVQAEDDKWWQATAADATDRPDGRECAT